MWAAANIHNLTFQGDAMIEGIFLLGATMPDLSIFQYNAVDNIFSMTVMATKMPFAGRG